MIQINERLNKWIWRGTQNKMSAISWQEEVTLWRDDDDVCFILDLHAQLANNSASSLKPQSTDRLVAPLWHIILIPSQPVFAFTTKCCVLRGEVINCICIVFGLNRTVLERYSNSRYIAHAKCLIIAFAVGVLYSMVWGERWFIWYWNYWPSLFITK